MFSIGFAPNLLTLNVREECYSRNSQVL